MMDVETATILMGLSIAGLLAIGVPLAFTTGAVAVVFGLLQFGPNSTLLIASRIYSFMNEFVLVSVPMFILMASVLERSGVARDLFRAMHVWAGGLKGGLAVQTMLVAVLMAAMTGIIGGEIVLLGLVALPQMLRLNYDRNLAIGTICAGGSLGTMIPPSIVLIFYGLTANVSIGDLFLATVMPGLLLAGLYIGYILVMCTLKPELGPPAPLEERNMPLREKLAMLKGVILPVFVAAMVLGTIYTGVASVSEAAGMGVVGVLISAALRGELTWGLLRASLLQTMATCGVLLWLTFGATALIGVYNLMGGAAFVKAMVTGLPFEPIVIVLIMMGILVVLGMFMDWIGILLLTMPIFVPIVTAFGYSPIWFGILFCMNMQVSYLTPPFGPAAFYLKGVAPPEITLNQIFNALWPFIGLQLLGLLLVVFFPEIALWLPSFVYGAPIR
jgi:tripartite ATP-independent transporter DctM subunit